MEKSDSKASHRHESGDERDNHRDDEQPTTSRGDTFNPVQISHNMNDLKALDFNSADEVRQAMKAILTGKIPPQLFSEEANHYPVSKVQNNPEPMKINELVQSQQLLSQEGHKTVQNQAQQNVFAKMRNSNQAWNSSTTNLGSSRLKKGGRPPKAGPSKKIKKPKISSMYLGKLSNVVPFRRHWDTDSESDVESVVIFY